MSFETAFRATLHRISATDPQGYTDAELSLAKARIPESLRTLYRVAGKSRITEVHNRLYSPEYLQPDDEGLVTFGEENQYVFFWAFRADEESPAVYQNHLDENAHRGPWVAEDQPMEDFLISFAYWNAANGAADFSAVGEVSDATWSLIGDYPVVWQSPDFVVRGKDTLFIVTDDGDFYCFGTNADGVKSMAKDLRVQWFDMG